MANVKDLKKKIKSTKSTLKITTAMKLVSAAKLNQAQTAIGQARPYMEELEEMITVISALIENYSHPFLEENDNDHSLLLVVSSDKGLCGGYNSQLIKAVRSHLAETSLNHKVYFLGKKGKEILWDEVNQGEMFHFTSSKPSFDEVKKMTESLQKQFENKEVGSVYVAFNNFHSAINFTPTIKRILPMALDEGRKEEIKKNHPFDFKYEPGAEEILNTLLPEVVVGMVHTGILSAFAAEHGSRMSAMDNASKNCKEIIRDLTLKMNKLRQASITTELIEVVSGAESLES